MPSPVIVLDTETFLFRQGRMAPRVVCVSLRYPDGKTDLVRPDDTQVDRVLQECAKGDTYICGHNLAYDMACLGATRPDLVPVIFEMYMNFKGVDTKLLYKLWLLERGKLSEDDNGRNRKVESFSLDSMAQTLLNAPPMDKGADGWRTRYGTLDSTPISEWPRRAVDYALGDVEAPAQILDVLEWERYPDLPRQTSYAWPLHLMSAYGLRTDGSSVAALRKHWQSVKDEATAQVKELGIFRENGTKDTKILQGVVGDAWKLTDIPEEAWERTGTGKFATDRVTLTELAKKAQVPALEAYTKLAHADKALNTFLPVFERGVQLPIHPGVDSLKATGRISQFKPNLQQLPNEAGFREVFVPRQGRVFLATDEDTAEVRAFGQTLLDEIGWSVIAENYQLDPAWDPHCDTGASIEGIGQTYAEAYKRHHVDGDKSFKPFRNMAKGLNFGRPGGMGAARLVDYMAAYGVTGVSEDRARELLELYDRKYPETVLYGNRLARLLRDSDSVLVKTYRSQRARLCVGNSAYSQARNAAFQPIVADITKLAALYVAHGQYVKGVNAMLYGTRLVNMVHDELVIEADESPDAYRGAAEEVEAAILKAAKVWCPDVPFRAGTTAMARLQKGDPVYNEAGELEVLP